MRVLCLHWRLETTTAEAKGAATDRLEDEARRMLETAPRATVCIILKEK